MPLASSDGNAMQGLAARSLASSDRTLAAATGKNSWEWDCARVGLLRLPEI
jgi:hypothetical protein